ncbi:hypothetical protein IWW50_006214, partial [Coemansia erecta]
MKAQQLPDECLFRVLDFAWGESRMISRFFERRSQHAHDYDQQRIHRILHARSIAPIHVCRSWRHSAIRRYFGALVVDLRRTHGQLPHTAMILARHVFVIVNSRHELGAVGAKVQVPNARILSLCVYDSHDMRLPGETHAQELAGALQAAMPQLCTIWLQCIGSVSAYTHQLLNYLCAGGARVTAIHLEATTSRSCAADVIRAHARDLLFLSLGKVSGGVLSTLVFNKGVQLEYTHLKRLLFAVQANTHIYANHQQRYTRTPFPRLEELYFDDSESSGLPREEWFAPLFDVFLSHPTKLKYLTFPIVYNTQRRVCCENCPELVGLRHIKCCWATGAWSAQQPESDSTRVLSAVASISTLECYVHPSYIAALSSVPRDIMCAGLWRLDLYGWPLTIGRMQWVLRAFERLQTLRVTLVQSNEDPDGEHQMAGSSLGCLTVGSVDDGLGPLELGRLARTLQSLKSLSRVSLY